ncbi:Selenocysteine lyase/Cysteine desulfurase [Terriglobus roseus]|uniref:Selenocysteine lyase/Cysteine desulfurase n=2 Tax=Terriglobus roseus TaxID=392734 RepID=A0A1G7P3I0_9BACT|nr:Selenocysteine lyase/Cysteine desulfurase [Terriglobus roseus]
MFSRRSLMKNAGAALLTARATSASATISMTPSTLLPARDAFVTPQYGVYINNARIHPMSISTRVAVDAYLDSKGTMAVKQTSTTSPISLVAKESFAKLINATPDEIAYVNSTSTGENLVVSALGLMHPAASGPKPNIVTDALHFEGSLYLYTELQKRGVDVRIVKATTNDAGAWIVDSIEFEKAVDKNTRLIAVSLVSWINGFTHNPKWLADLAHAHGAKLFLDAVQGAGCMPIDVKASGVDFLASASYKWLMGDFGIGFLYARADVLPTLQRPLMSFRQFGDMEYHALPGDKPGPYPATFDQLQNAAGYFETGTYANPVIAALSASLPWILQLGVPNIQHHAHTLNGILRAELPKLGYACITPEDAGASIIAFHVKDDEATNRKLKASKVDISLYPGRMRIAPSVYNNEADIHTLLNALE